jgi:hypothetical protein
MRAFRFAFMFLFLCVPAASGCRPAQAGIFGKDTRDECLEKYAHFAPTIFLSSFYYQICEMLSEPEPRIENKMFFAPIPKPPDCAGYSPSAHYITPHELGICRIDRWKLRQKWAKCRLAKKESPDAQTDRAVELVLSGQDSSECGPWAPLIGPAPVPDACVWPVCPFWSLSPSVPSAIDKFALHQNEIVHSDSNLRQCAEVRETVNAMLALYDADRTAYKSSADYAVLKKRLDNLPYPELPCPAGEPAEAPSDAPAAAPPVVPSEMPAPMPTDAQPSALPVIPPDSSEGQPQPRMIFQ